jgi:acyl-[acyl-carrier-protein]-phospholipid O-acyltransferase/long-chain-fatty-acid--[acyl-carrier-protein] ligase
MSHDCRFPLLAGWLIRTLLRVRGFGRERLPSHGGCLLVLNRASWANALLLRSVSPRPIRFLVRDFEKAAAFARAGEVVALIPEPVTARPGLLLHLDPTVQALAAQSDVPVVPVWVERQGEHLFSFQRLQWLRRWLAPRTVDFGEAMVPGCVDGGRLRERLMELGEAAFQRRPLLQGHLGIVSLRGLARRPSETLLWDGTDGASMSRGMLLAAGMALARHLERHCAASRIAILLPPGRGAVVANLGVMLAGKTPVNLNFTAGRAAQQAAVRIAELHDVITAGPVLSRFAEVPLPPNVVRLEQLLPSMKRSIALWRVAVSLLPWRMLAAAVGARRSEGGHAEAVVLFTSGSSGEPKGVVLSHHNLLGNIAQFGQMLDLSLGDTLLASLPFFHSFGCTVTLWFPMIERVRMVTYPNPLDAEVNASLIERYGITLLLSTPTFLRAYLRKATREQLETLKLIVTGAEKLPRELAAAFAERFGKEVREGYGLTETSPVASVNLPEPADVGSAARVQPSARSGSVGQLAPGLAAQIRDPETGEPMSLLETGMIWLRGPNIFEGYLHDPQRTAEVIRDGWFKTGDLGRFDADGFLYIEGRVSRFSKIGGEMVPHETLETKIREALEDTDEQERTRCIVGVPDAAKGEAIVLLSTREIDLKALRTRLLAMGVPALWIPKTVKLVPQIPVLASGKLDLKACQQAALALG